MSTHRILFLVFLLLGAAGCATTKKQNINSVIVNNRLSQEISLPLKIPVAYHAPSEDLNEVLRLGSYYHAPGAAMKESLESAFDGYFVEQGTLSPDKKLALLFKFSSDTSAEASWGSYTVDLRLSVLDIQGNTIFETSDSKRIATGTMNDRYAFQNAYMAAIKETLNLFLNQKHAELLAHTNPENSRRFEELDFSVFFDEAKPSSTGSGFFVNNKGQVVTAAHVLKECIKTEINYNGEKHNAKIATSSKLLDIAVLDTSAQPTAIPGFRSEEKPTPLLGESVFVTGYPLADIMSAYPNLTVGNVSSLGALRGAKDRFQFTAPIQSGNSGGPVISYKGELIGMATSSLNARFIAKKTGNLPQNVNFAVNSSLIRKYLTNHSVDHAESDASLKFEESSQAATQQTVQVLCYQ